MISPAAALLSRVEQTIRRERLFCPGDTLIVALSGGADSTALLDLLARLPGYNLRLIAAHLNHRLRGAESDADEEFCRQTAARYAIPFEVRRVDVASAAAHGRLNLEDAGRQARIDFFDTIRDTHGAAAVALAHHGDDQAETVLMRLLRGSGMTGLSGMTYRNGRGYVRPLLDITRAEIEQYLSARGLEWREDSSNSDTAYLRNRLRHELLPLLETYNPAIRSRLAATAAIIGGNEALLEELTAQAAAESCREDNNTIVSSVAHLRSLATPLRRRVLRHIIKQLAGTLEAVSLRHIDALDGMIGSDRPNARLPLPHGVSAVREYDRMVWMRSSSPALRNCPVTAPDSDFELTIPAPGIYLLPGGGTITVETASEALFPAPPGTAYFSPGKTPLPWRIRTFRPGDRITPFGMNGTKKVKDIFIDRKLPPSERRSRPLVFCGDELIWIAGVCASEACRIPAGTAAMLRVTWQPLN